METRLRALEGKYEILGKLHTGGMGAVYKVRHRLLDQIRVVKMMRPQLEDDQDFQQRFEDEAKVAVRLRHTNVAVFYDFSLDEEGNAYIVMEYIPGRNLLEIRSSFGSLDVGVASRLAVQGLGAIGYLHREKLVHRDISPDNLLVTLDVEQQPQVKLIDFGIVKALDAEKPRTQAGVFMGKLSYASPEHFGGRSGNDKVEPRSDLYSMGIVLYELLTGMSPIAGTEYSKVLASHLIHPPLSFEESDPTGRIRPEIREVVLRALEKDASKRFEDAEAFIAALTQAAGPDIEASQVRGGAWDELRRTLLDARGSTKVQNPGSTQDRLDGLFPRSAKSAVSKAPQTGSRSTTRVRPLESVRRSIAGMLADEELDDALVQLREAEEIYGSKRFADLRESHQKALARVERRRIVTEKRRAAVELAEKGSFHEAIALLGEALGLEPENDAIRAYLGELEAAEKVRLENEAREAAIDDVRWDVSSLMERGELDQAEALLVDAEAKLGAEPFDRLRGLLQEALAERELQEKVQALSSAAAGAFDEGEFTRAVQLLTEALSLDPHDERLASRLREAEEAATRRKEEECRRIRVAEARSEVEDHGRSENWDEALTALQRAEARDGVEPFDDLRERVTAALERRRLKEQVQVLLGKVRVLLGKEEFGEAVVQIAAAESLLPGDTEIQSVREEVQRAEEEASLRREKEARLGEIQAQIESLLEAGKLLEATKAAQKAYDEFGDLEALGGFREAVTRHLQRVADRRLAELDGRIQESLGEDRVVDAESLLEEMKAVDATAQAFQKAQRRVEVHRAALIARFRRAVEVNRDRGEFDAALDVVQAAEGKLGDLPDAEQLRIGIREAREAATVRRVDELLDEGRAHLKEGHTEKALACVKQAQVLGVQKTQVDALREQIEEARVEIKDRLQVLRRRKKIQREVLIPLREGNLEEAEERMEKARNELAGTPLLDDLESRLGKLRARIRLDQASATLVRAEELLGHGDLEGARELVSAATEVAPDVDGARELSERIEEARVAQNARLDNEAARKRKLNLLDKAMEKGALAEADLVLEDLVRGGGEDLEDRIHRLETLRREADRQGTEAREALGRIESLISEGKLAAAEAGLADAMALFTGESGVAESEWLRLKGQIHLGRQAALAAAEQRLEALDWTGFDIAVAEARELGATSSRIDELVARAARLRTAGTTPGRFPSVSEDTSRGEAVPDLSGGETEGAAEDPATGRPLGMMIAVAVALVTVLAVGAYLLYSRSVPGPEVESASPEVAVASPPETQLVIDALPWAEIAEIRAVEGDFVLHPTGSATPFAGSVEPGKYQVTLRHPSLENPMTFEVEVAAGETFRKVVEIVPLTADRYFEENW